MSSLIWGKQCSAKWAQWDQGSSNPEEVSIDRLEAILRKVEEVVREPVEGGSIYAAADFLLQAYCRTKEERYLCGVQALPDISKQHLDTVPVWMQSYTGPPTPSGGTFNHAWLSFVDSLILDDTDGDLCAPLKPAAPRGLYPLYLDDVRERIMHRVYNAQDEVEMDLRYVAYYAMLDEEPRRYQCAQGVLSRLTHGGLPWASVLKPTHLNFRACHAVVSALTALDPHNILSDLTMLSSRLRRNNHENTEAFVQDLQMLLDAAVRGDNGEESRAIARSMAEKLPSALAEAGIWS